MLCPKDFCVVIQMKITASFENSLFILLSCFEQNTRVVLNLKTQLERVDWSFACDLRASILPNLVLKN